MLYAIATILAVEEGTEAATGLELVLPDPAELIWGLVGFALLFAFLQWKVFPSLNQMLEKRRMEIQGQIEAAQAERTEAERTRREYEASIADARSQANAIIDEARERAERLRADIVAKAEEEANAIRQRAIQEQQAERGRLLQELRGQVATISVDLASQIVGREVDRSRHEELVDQYISQLSGMN